MYINSPGEMCFPRMHFNLHMGSFWRIYYRLNFDIVSAWSRHKSKSGKTSFICKYVVFHSIGLCMVYVRTIFFLGKLKLFLDYQWKCENTKKKNQNLWNRIYCLCIYNVWLYRYAFKLNNQMPSWLWWNLFKFELNFSSI